jgi:hypothetical protein
MGSDSIDFDLQHQFSTPVALIRRLYPSSSDTIALFIEGIIVSCYGNKLLRNTTTQTIRKISTESNFIGHYRLPCFTVWLLCPKGIKLITP